MTVNLELRRRESKYAKATELAASAGSVSHPDLNFARHNRCQYQYY